ncbi:Peptidase S8A, DUF1034 C-terminal [Cynara cardunculus var. scolymus]|uniref:Peptidase S8A, DUF1034 C-terminal n=1 Tax=Cynara cardunculus var. scolymus TaxID=59895 RepID=A0A124SAK4_CYNCS|nr:Peptidase S8A, DUF1034 C-terminal [Cynara cardunculus var. scolymus]
MMLFTVVGGHGSLEMRTVERMFTSIILFLLLVIGKAEIYIVMVEGEPITSYRGGVSVIWLHHTLVTLNSSMILFLKRYSIKELTRNSTVTSILSMADTLRRAPGVKSVDKDWKVRKLTTHTPQFLGLPTGVWPTGGGFDRAGEDIVIGFVDSGIFPHHPSFANHNSEPYGPLPKYRGKCEVDSDTKRSFCNGKIVGAQHFAEAAIAAGAFNPSVDFASPMDGDGHGSHTAAIAAGNNGIPVRVHGYEFGKASGMAPRARIAVYKALYRLFGGFVADVVAAIEQAVHDGVDILNLSVGPNSPPATTRTTFLNPFDATLLSAVKAGVFVAQAAGNGGPFTKSLVSYTATSLNQKYTLVAANDVVLDSSVMKFSPTDCQRPEVLNKNMVKGNILLCGYSFNFVIGMASVKKVAETARSLGAIGFVLAVEYVSAGTKFDPVPTGMPGILITDVSKSKELIDYYKASTSRDWTGRVKSFKATGIIGEGLEPILHKSAPIVALFSARGPNIKDYSFRDADLLKPDILAPGALIWASWSPNGTDEVNYLGENFAMISGTSMAAPHISGIAALIKQKHPRWSPAAIKSALMTTSNTLDRAEKPILAEQYSGSETLMFVPATPFDYGSGHVNPRAALDPGLIFDAGATFPCRLHTYIFKSLFSYNSGNCTSYEDYLGFLCTTPGINYHELLNFTHRPCNYTIGHPYNLNSPSITVSHLVRTQTISRTVTNVNEEETYTITARMAPAIAIETSPPAMTLRPGASHRFTVTLTVQSLTGTYSFGEVLLKGSRRHKVRIPVVAMGYDR